MVQPMQSIHGPGTPITIPISCGLGGVSIFGVSFIYGGISAILYRSAFVHGSQIALCLANRLRTVSVELGGCSLPHRLLRGTLSVRHCLPHATNPEAFGDPDKMLERTHRAMLTREKTSRVRLVKCLVEWNFFTPEKDALLPPVVEVRDTFQRVCITVFSRATGDILKFSPLLINSTFLRNFLVQLSLGVCP